MTSVSQFFDTLTADARRWPDHTDYDLHGPTRCALRIPMVLDQDRPKGPPTRFQGAPHGYCWHCQIALTRVEARDRSHVCGWAMRSVGCHWTHPRFPSAVVSTTNRPMPDGSRFSGYVAVVNFAEIGTFHTRQLAQRAVEVHLGA